MGTLIYTAGASLDGFIENTEGNFDWALPSAELHQFFNDLEARGQRILCGRRLYETMAWWDDEANWKDEPPVVQDYGRLWKAKPKVVYSRNGQTKVGPRAELRTALDGDELRRWKAETPGPMSIGGADLGGQALLAGLVDEVNLILYPVTLGAGKRALPVGWGARLHLLETRTFEGGEVLLRYRVET